MTTYEFDRFLRYDELVAWLDDLAARHPDLVAIESYGRSHEGRDLLIATVTDGSTGSHERKPAHWVDASIHAVELTGTVAACRLLDRLVTGFVAGNETIVRALQTRTFYVVPRVNPDGAEWALADSPRFRRSSVRAWPHTDGRRWPGLHAEDIDGDGRILEMRRPDPNGAWMPHPDEPRLLIPVPPDGPPVDAARFQLFAEGTIEDYDGFTVPRPRPPEGLDLNRNYPAGWGTTIPGAGDHPLSEPEIDALVRAIAARPNVCGFNAYHTPGGVLLRPSSTAADSALPPGDVWAWKQLATRGTELTGYPAHSVYEDFTWDPNDTMSGASDDWAYEHLGVFGWTTEFWDIILAATGTKMSTHFWYTGPTDDEALAVLRWLDGQHEEHGDPATAGFVDWYEFDHPQLGPVELGGWNELFSWLNPPPHRLLAEVDPHADFAVFQALSSPRLEIAHTEVVALGTDLWRIELGVVNTGWLPTNVSQRARKADVVRPVIAEITRARGDHAVDVVGGSARIELGQLAGSMTARSAGSGGGTDERALAAWTVRAPAGTEFVLTATHQRAGTVEVLATTAP